MRLLRGWRDVARLAAPRRARRLPGIPFERAPPQAGLICLVGEGNF
jgi:hypothetical protein